MKLMHYSGAPIEKLDQLDYSEEESKKRKIRTKPQGFWLSVEDHPYQGWKDWCVSEGFRVENLTYKYSVKLKSNAKILHLDTSAKIIEFSKSKSSPDDAWPDCMDSYNIDWDSVKQEYQGIIISPYQWDCRLALDTGWYYSWDCASGCIWDMSCIEEFTLVCSEPIILKKEEE